MISSSNLSKHAKYLAAIAICLSVLDGVYLATVGPAFSSLVRTIQGESIRLNIVATVICYALLVVGLYYFIILPRRTPTDAFALGVLVYGVYDTTNLATFRKWKWELAVIDTLWGGVLFATTTVAVNVLLRGG